MAGRDDIGDRPLNERIPDNVYVRHVKSTGRSYVLVDAAKACGAPSTRCRSPRSRRRARKGACFETYEGDRRLPYTKYNLFKGMRTSTSTFIKCWAIDKSLLAQKLGLPEDDMLTTLPPPPPSNVVPLRQ